MKIESCTATAYKMNILWFVAIFGTIRSSSGDFFSDLEKLDIDTQLREIDDMLDKLDDDGTDDALNFDYWSDFFSDKCVYRCRNGNNLRQTIDFFPSHDKERDITLNIFSSIFELELLRLRFLFPINLQRLLFDRIMVIV